jgi:hypothetical protein
MTWFRLLVVFGLLVFNGSEWRTSATAGGEEKKIEEVSAKEIEVNGKELEGQRRAMTCSFVEVKNVWVDLLLKDSDYVGVFVRDSKGELFQYGFADKAKFGKQLLNMKRGDKMRLIGKIKQVDVKFGFMIEDIQK